MPRSAVAPEDRDAGSQAAVSPDRTRRIAFFALAVAFAGSQLLDFLSAQGLSSTEPRGHFAEVNPLLAHIGDPVAREYLGFLLKVAVVVLVVGVARVQRRRAIGTGLLVIGTVAGLFGAWSNLHPWGW